MTSPLRKRCPSCKKSRKRIPTSARQADWGKDATGQMVCGWCIARASGEPVETGNGVDRDATTGRVLRDESGAPASRFPFGIWVDKMVGRVGLPEFARQVGVSIETAKLWRDARNYPPAAERDRYMAAGAPDLIPHRAQRRISAAASVAPPPPALAAERPRLRVAATPEIDLLLDDDRELVRRFGVQVAQRIRERLQHLREASSLFDLKLGRPHVLQGLRAGQLSFRLDRSTRLVVEPDGDPPRRPDGSIAWPDVTAVRVIFVGNYH